MEGKSEIRVAADGGYARFFNESTGMAITAENNAYVEAAANEVAEEEQPPAPLPQKKSFIEALKAKFKK